MKLGVHPQDRLYAGIAIAALIFAIVALLWAAFD
jgi:hypothetical protein